MPTAPYYIPPPPMTAGERTDVLRQFADCEYVLRNSEDESEIICALREEKRLIGRWWFWIKPHEVGWPPGEWPPRGVAKKS